MKKYIFLILILLSQQVGFGVNPKNTGVSIMGTVIDQNTGTSISYANIEVVGLATGAYTDQQGRFEIKDLETGEYTLRIRNLGYLPQEVTVKVDSLGDDVNVNVNLVTDEIMINEVVVSANRHEMKRIDAPVVVNVLGMKLFETVNSIDLAKSLSFQSGLRVENNCQNCGFPQVRINGLEGPYSQILINSRPVMSSLSGVYGLEQIPVNMIDRVEVVRGGGSALFGANAVAGTINIITKDPISNSFQISTTMSNMGGKSWDQYFGANASLISSDNTYGIALYQSYHNRNPYDHDDDGFTEVGKLNMNNFGFRSYYRPSEMSRINLEYHATKEFRRGGNKLNLPPHETDITEQTEHVINSGGMSYDLYLNDYKHKISVYGSAQHVDRKSYYGALQDDKAYGKTNDLTWVGGATYTGNYDKFLLAPAILTAGIEYQDNVMDDYQIGYDTLMTQKVRIAGAFAQSEWKVSDFTFMGGLRLDKHNLIDDPILSPRLNVMYKPSDFMQYRMTYSTGFRAPQAYDEDLHITAVGGKRMRIVLAPDLKPERSNSFSASADFTKTFGHFQANFLVEGFYTLLNNVFVLEEIRHEENTTIQERRNGEGAKVYGVNFDGKIAHGTDAQLQVGFTIQRSKYNVEEAWSEDPAVAPTKRMTRTPDYYGYFTFTSALSKQFDFSLSGIYTGKMIVPHFASDPDEIADYYENGSIYSYLEQDRMEETPDFFELNLKLNYTIPLKGTMKLQLNGGIQNIFNNFQKDLDKGAFRDSGYFYGPTQPRTFFIGLKIMG
ncbi:TonB-dependent receptor [Bacteroidales bacterium OttesenSCG-928-M06]|nr:TonB-dependent receptor [Bacteroidales bacterium OttesenSCG-928-M06]